MLIQGSAPPDTRSQAQLIEQARGPLTRMLSRHIRRDNDVEKTHLYGEAVLNHLYYQNEQYVQLSPGLDAVEYKRIGEELRPGQRAHDLNPFVYDYILPIFRGDTDKLVALLGNRAPNVKSAPIIPGNPEQIGKTRIANRGARYLRAHWGTDAVSRTLVHMLLLSGTVFGRVSWNPDAVLYGTSQGSQMVDREVPEFDPYFQCFKCGTESSQDEVQANGGRCPQCEAELGPADRVESSQTIPSAEMSQTMGQSYPNAATELSLCSVLTVDTPYHVKGENLDKCPWLLYEYYTQLYEILAYYSGQYATEGEMPMSREELIRKIGVVPTAGPLQGDNRGARAEERLSSPSLSDYSAQGTQGQNYKALSTSLYLHPKMYEVVPDDPSGNLREQLQSTYPKGCQLVWANSFLLGIHPVMLTRRWSICKPGVSEWIYGDPYLSDYRAGIDVVNDFLNVVIQAGEHSIGELAYDQELVDREYLRNHAADLGTWLPVRPQSGRQLSDSFFRIPGASMDEYMVRFIEIYIKYLRESKGVTPELFGGGDVEQTARGAEIRRTQALAQHNTMWSNIRAFHEHTQENGIYLAAEKSGGKLYMRSRGPEGESVIHMPNLHLVLTGGWRYEASESMPMSQGARRDWIMDLLQNPAGYTTFGIVDQTDGQLVPQNLPRIHEAASLDDWYMPSLDAYNGLLEQVQQLIEMGPKQAMGDDGQPFMDSPLWTPHEPLIYDPPFAIKVLRGWLQSEEGRDLQGEPGWQAVVAHLSRYVKYMQDQAQARAQAQMREQVQQATLEAAGKASAAGADSGGTGAVQ